MEDEEIVIPRFSGSKLDVWITAMEEIMLRFLVPRIQQVNFAHVYVEGIAGEWVRCNIDRICWMSWYQFVKALWSEFGEDGDEKLFESVDSDPAISSVCAEPIESFQSDSLNVSLISKSILPVQSVDTIGNSAIHIPIVSVSNTADTNDRRSLHASGDNMLVAPVVSVKFARVRDSVVHGNAYDIISKLDDFVAKIDVPIAWLLYASNGNSTGLNQICSCKGYATPCEACITNSDLESVVVDYSSQHALEIGAAAFSLNTSLSPSVISNCVSSIKASAAANVSHVSQYICQGYGTINIAVKWFTAIFISELFEQIVRTNSLFDDAIRVSLDGSHFADYIVTALVPCNYMYCTSILQGLHASVDIYKALCVIISPVDTKCDNSVNGHNMTNLEMFIRLGTVARSCLLVKTVSPELVGAYRYRQHLGRKDSFHYLLDPGIIYKLYLFEGNIFDSSLLRQVIVPETLKERVRGRSVSNFSCVCVFVSSGVTFWQDSGVTSEHAIFFAQRSFTSGFYFSPGFTKVLSSIFICNGIWGTVGNIHCENSLEIRTWKGTHPCHFHDFHAQPCILYLVCYKCRIKLLYRSIGNEIGYHLGYGHYGGLLSMSSNDKLAPKCTSLIYKVFSVVRPLQVKVGPRKSMMLCIATMFHALVLADAYAYSLVEITITQKFDLQAFPHIACIRNTVYHRPATVNEGMNLSLHISFSKFKCSEFNKISEYIFFGHVGFIFLVNDPMTMFDLLLYDSASMNTLDVYELSVALNFFTRGGLPCSPEVSMMFHVFVMKGLIYVLLIVEMTLHTSCSVTIFGVISCECTVSLPINRSRVTIQWLLNQNYTCYHFDLLDDNSQGLSVRRGISNWEENLSLASPMLVVRIVKSLWHRIPKFFVISIRQESSVALDCTLSGEDNFQGRQRGSMRQLKVDFLTREPIFTKHTSWLLQGHEKNVDIFNLKGEWLSLWICLSEGKRFIAESASVLV